MKLSCMVLRSITVILAVLALAQAGPCRAQNVLFFEGFDGAYTQSWVSTPGILPTETAQPINSANVLHLGDFNRSFVTIDGASCLRAETPNAGSWRRYGAVANTPF